MLYPYESSTREVKSLDGVWDFCPDAEGVGEQERWFETGLPQKLHMPVPASYNDITTDTAIRDLIGNAWYERTVFIPSTWKDQRIVLRFGSVTHRGKVWVNGEFLMEHKGGYLPFEGEISQRVKPGDKIRITVCVNNILDFQMLPPGEIEILDNPYRYEKPTKVQRYFHDFYNYAGIHRPVKLYSTPVCHITDVSVNPELQGADGVLQYAVKQEGAGSIRVEVRDAQGVLAAEAAGAEGTVLVPQAHLWNPGAPYLYEFTTILEQDGEVIDVYHQKIGIRTVKVEGDRFLINGKPFYFKGFGKHEDMNLKGKGLDDVTCIRDFNLMQWIGANSFRTSHYPYAEEMLDWADEYGFVVIDESPAVGMTFFNEEKQVFVPERVNDETKRFHIQVMQDLIDRDKNHPCVVMWSIANEPSSWEDNARLYFKDIIDAVRSADPHRPVTMVSYAFPYGSRKDKVADLLDVVCINKYYSWYEDSGMLDVVEFQAEKELTLWHENYHKPIIITEYGADSISGFHSVPAVMFTEEYQIEMVKRFNHVFDKLDFVIGEHLWAFADFATKQGTTRVIGNKKGIFTRERNPKSIAFYLKERWSHLENTYTKA